MRRVLYGILAALTITPLACDKGTPSASTPSAPPAVVADVPAAPPTTQEFLDSPRGSLSLVNMPLTLSVPDGWRLTPPNNPSFLEGAAPDGPLQISVSMLDVVADRRRQLFFSGALDQSQQHPQRIQVRQLTSKSGLQILERITYANDPTTQPAPTTLPSQLLSWNIIIFVPYKDKFIPCSFDLLGLTQKQYTDDEPLVDSIIETAEEAKVPAFQ